MNHTAQPTISDHELFELRCFIQDRSGMVFDESRWRFFTARVREHMQSKSVSLGHELLRSMKASNAAYDEMLECVLTQETSFFRYPAIFDALSRRVLPEIQTRKFWSDPRSLRVWSAGCSTGEEPYSIALSICETLDCPEAWNVEVLATDISRKALNIAAEGRYGRRELLGVDPSLIDQYFTREGHDFVVRPRLRKLVDFAPMNLAQMVYMGRFDCIFCMNVLIYFSEELRVMLIRRFSDFLEPGGYLFLGHAESVAKAGLPLEPIVVGDSLIYRKAMPQTSAGGKQ
jgi:chemotaxis protein methyltransferase CheR